MHASIRYRLLDLHDALCFTLVAAERAGDSACDIVALQRRLELIEARLRRRHRSRLARPRKRGAATRCGSGAA